MYKNTYMYLHFVIKITWLIVQIDDKIITVNLLVVYHIVFQQHNFIYFYFYIVNCVTVCSRYRLLVWEESYLPMIFVLYLYLRNLVFGILCFNRFSLIFFCFFKSLCLVWLIQINKISECNFSMCRSYMVTLSVIQPQWLHQVAPEYARRCRASRWRRTARLFGKLRTMSMCQHINNKWHYQRTVQCN